jgi:hypothetical protein
VREVFPELENLKAGLREREALQRIGGNEWEEGFMMFHPTKTAGTVMISAGNLPEIHWESLASLPPPPPPAAGAQLGVPQPAGFDLLSSLGQGAPQPQQVAPAGSSWQQQTALPALPALPELSTSIRLPAASQATLAKHALLPSAAFGSTSQQHWQPERQQQPALAQRPLYPELAQLEPPPPPPQQQQHLDAALASLDIGRQQQQQQQADGVQPPQQQQPYLQPSPYGELALGPQEVGVLSAPRPTQPLPPDASCCQPSTAVAPSGGVAEVKRLQKIRDVHVSVALMDEFMRWVAGWCRWVPVGADGCRWAMCRGGGLTPLLLPTVAVCLPPAPLPPGPAYTAAATCAPCCMLLFGCVCLPPTHPLFHTPLPAPFYLRAGML